MASRAPAQLISKPLKPPPSPSPSPSPPPPCLTDDILWEIFLRLLSPPHPRASTACVSFRRIITDCSFLRRFRSLHPPILLGFLCGAGFQPALPPHPSAPAARALALAADFSFSFLPSPGRWHPRDGRDGRVLLARATEVSDDEDEYDAVADIFSDLAVCDPLSRRYVLLPAIPDDLIASVLQSRLLDFEHFLVPTGDEEETPVRVLCMVQCEKELVAYVFLSGTGQWHPLHSTVGSL